MPRSRRQRRTKKGGSVIVTGRRAVKAVAEVTLLLAMSLHPAQGAAPARLLDAVAAGDVDAARPLVRDGKQLDSRDENGMTPLMKACQAGRQDMVQLLLMDAAR